MKPLAIDKVLRDERLLGTAIGPIDSWATWMVALKAAFALLLTDAERELFATISGNRSVPTRRVRELWCIVGRRGGKSRVAAALAVYFALFCPAKLAPGETGVVLVLAASVEQSKVVFGYVLAFLRASPVLRKEIDSHTKGEIRLKSGTVIATHPNSFRSVRGRTLLACIFDEIAFWRSEDSANPDAETYTAILPTLSTSGGMLIAISTPYRQLGLLHQKHRDHYGVDGDDVLVIKGPTALFNPTLAASEIAAQTRADPTAAAAEWLAEFRGDVSSFLPDELIDRAIDYSRPIELPAMTGIPYRAFVDASGGTGNDSYCLAIGHQDKELFVVDLVYGTVPGQTFDPAEVTKRYADVCKHFRIGSVLGDHYSAGWVVNAWAKTGISYVQSAIPKSQLYLETLPLWSAGLIRIPDHPTLVRELRLLERRVHRSGRDTVDHGRSGGHDDYANSACGVIHSIAISYGYPDDATLRRIFDGDSGAPPTPTPIPPTMSREMYARLTAPPKIIIAEQPTPPPRVVVLPPWPTS